MTYFMLFVFAVMAFVLIGGRRIWAFFTRGICVILEGNNQYYKSIARKSPFDGKLNAPIYWFTGVGRATLLEDGTVQQPHYVSRWVKGFTLIELIVVVAIVALLTSVVIASINGAKNSSEGESVMASTAHAAETLPEGVSRFTDGAVTCYTYNKYAVIGSTDRVGGISCVK